MKKLIALAFCVCIFASFVLAQAPKTVLHIINVKWKEDATPEQIKTALEFVQQLPIKYPGIKHVWTKNIKYQAQEGYKQAIVMEFESEDALKKYENSPAQLAWYKLYLPIREESHTHDITN
jgi:hypothetical protein